MTAWLARPAAPRTGCCLTRRCRGCRRHGSDGSGDGDGISCPNPRRAPRRRPAYRRCCRAPGPPRSAPLRRPHGAPARSGDGCGATNAPARRPRRIRHGCGCRRYRSCRRARCGSDRRYRDGRKRSCPCPPARRHVTHDHCASDGTCHRRGCRGRHPRGRHRARRARFPARAAPAPGTARTSSRERAAQVAAAC